MDSDTAKLCTDIVQMFSTSTQVLIGAILTIVLNIIVLLRVYLSSRKTV